VRREWSWWEACKTSFVMGWMGFLLFAFPADGYRFKHTLMILALGVGIGFILPTKAIVTLSIFLFIATLFIIKKHSIDYFDLEEFLGLFWLVFVTGMVITSIALGCADVDLSIKNEVNKFIGAIFH